MVTLCCRSQGCTCLKCTDLTTCQSKNYTDQSDICVAEKLIKNKKLSQMLKQRYILYIIGVIVLLSSCARMGRPDGAGTTRHRRT